MTVYPLVSVRIPSFNHERYVKRCLDSVLQDSYPNKEIIIVDDGSVDNSVSVINDWMAENGGRIPVTFIAREHKGLAATLNELIQHSSGDYYVSLASDDYLLDGGIELRIAYLRSHPDKLAVISDCVVVDADGNQILESGMEGLYRANKSAYATDKGLRYEVILRWAIPGPVLLVDRRIYNIVGGYDESLMVEDWNLYLKLVALNLLGYVEGRVSAYRVHGRNTSQRNGFALESTREFITVALKNIRHFSWYDKAVMLKAAAMYTYRYMKLKLN